MGSWEGNFPQADQSEVLDNIFRLSIKMAYFTIRIQILTSGYRGVWSPRHVGNVEIAGSNPATLTELTMSTNYLIRAGSAG